VATTKLHANKDFGDIQEKLTQNYVLKDMTYRRSLSLKTCFC